MMFYRWKRQTAWQVCSMSLFLIPLFLLAACGGSNTTPPPAQSLTGQQLLTQVTQQLNAAKTLHGIFKLSSTNNTDATANGTANLEVWTEAPAKNRTVVLQSSLSQFTTGVITVANDKQSWMYDPAKKVVYTGQVTPSAATGVPTVGTGTPTVGSTSAVGQSLSPAQLLQSTLTQSDATLTSSSATVNGHTVYDVHVVSQSKDDTGAPDYTGEVYIDTTTKLPIEISLDLQGAGKSLVDISMLTLNQAIPASTFAFTSPAGVKVLPFPQTSVDTTSTTLAQAQQKAGFHLLSIPKSQSADVLKSISAIGPAGTQIYTLSYSMGKVSFTLVESKALAGQERDSFDSEVKVRGVTGTLQGNGSGGTTTTKLAWTENGVGIYISGNLTKVQLLAIAQSLA